jgi:hypothetical protein
VDAISNRQDHTDFDDPTGNAATVKEARSIRSLPLAVLHHVSQLGIGFLLRRQFL